MKYNLLGKSDLLVSEISFGCMSLGEDFIENTTLLHYAFDHGINFFDTADLYQKGANETTVGKALKNIRPQVVIATKAGNQWKPDGNGWDWNPTKEYIIQAADESLRRLQTDYIDLYQLHGGTISDPIDETIEAFETLQAQGKIRHYGISSIRPNVLREYVQRSNIVSVMMQYSLLDRRPEESCLELLQHSNIGVLARGTLAKGLLTGKTPASYLNHSTDDVQRVVDAVNAFGNGKRKGIRMATRFVLHHPAVTSAVIGVRTMSQLKDCLILGEEPALEEPVYQALASSAAINTYEEHR